MWRDLWQSRRLKIFLISCALYQLSHKTTEKYHRNQTEIFVLIGVLEVLENKKVV
jgi:hypothetical protein